MYEIYYPYVSKEELVVRCEPHEVKVDQLIKMFVSDLAEPKAGSRLLSMIHDGSGFHISNSLVSREIFCQSS